MTQQFTEFCCRSGGSNLCSGSLAGGPGEEPIAPTVNYTGGTIGGVAGLGAGTWTASTNTFLPPSGRNPVTDGIVAGQFVSLYSGSPTATGYIARVVSAANATNGAVVLAVTVVAGTKPGGTGAAMNMVVGGAWQGPNTTDQFFPLTLGTLVALTTITTAFPTRINFKNDQQYNISATTAYAGIAPTTLKGYTTTYGDGGKAVLDGGTSGASYVLMNLTATSPTPCVEDFIIQNNGATGSATGFAAAGRATHFRVVVHDVQGAGFSNAASTGAPIYLECEAYACNKSNTASLAGFLGTSGLYLVRCFAHDNAGSNTRGVLENSATVPIVAIDCIFSGNGSHGVEQTGNTGVYIEGCEFYNNAGSGFYQSAGNNNIVIENSNFVKNGGFGIRFTAATDRLGIIANCGFGSGTQANTSGDIDRADIGQMLEIGTVTYASGVTPWNDPANGDFKITLAAAQNTGRGNFTETSASLSAPNTVGYPDIGAAQHLPAVPPIGQAIVIQRGTPF